MDNVQSYVQFSGKECHRTGTKFVPRAGHKPSTSDEDKGEKEGWESGSDEENDEEDLTDLYPGMIYTQCTS